MNLEDIMVKCNKSVTKEQIFYNSIFYKVPNVVKFRDRKDNGGSQ